jgi:hypothetical protein
MFSLFLLFFEPVFFFPIHRGVQQIVGYAPIAGDQIVVWAYAKGEPETNPYSYDALLELMRIEERN